MSSTLGPEITDPDPAVEGGRDLPRGRLRIRSVADLSVTVAVVLAVVIGMVLLVPRPNTAPIQNVDLAAAAAASAGRLSFPPAVPQGLPVGWVPTTAEIRHSGNGVLTWHVDFQTPDGRYASIEQAASPGGQWEIILDSGGTDRRPQPVGDQVWIQRYTAVRDVTALIYRGREHTTMVTSKGGGVADAVILARSIPASSL